MRVVDESLDDIHHAVNRVVENAKATPEDITDLLNFANLVAGEAKFIERVAERRLRSRHQ